MKKGCFFCWIPRLWDSHGHLSIQTDLLWRTQMVTWDLAPSTEQQDTHSSDPFSSASSALWHIFLSRSLLKKHFINESLKYWINTMLPTENSTGSINFILPWIVVSVLHLFGFVWKPISNLSRNNSQVELQELRCVSCAQALRFFTPPGLWDSFCQAFCLALPFPSGDWRRAP